MRCTPVSTAASHVMFVVMSLRTRSFTITPLFIRYLRLTNTHLFSEGEYGSRSSAPIVTLSFLNHRGPSSSFSTSLRLPERCHLPLCHSLSSSYTRLTRHSTLTRAYGKAHGHQASTISIIRAIVSLHVRSNSSPTRRHRATRPATELLYLTAVMHFPIPNPVPSRIAQVYCRSDDPGTASLLGIPPELRNQIYEYLLVNRRSVNINAKINLGHKNIGRVSNFAGSSAIIHTCRQIYYEALGILYGQNIFHFQYSVQHEYSDNCHIVRSVKTCIKWVENIGSCLSVLRAVTIDIGEPYLQDECLLESETDILDAFEVNTPILQLPDIIWNDIANDISIKFEYINGSSWYMPPLSIKELEVLNGKCEEVTKILHELGKRNCLGLKETRRLLQEVYVDPSGIQGTIQYRRTDYGTNVCRKFRLSKETQTYELVPLPNPLSLPDLPTEIITDIAELALPNHDVTYNFDTGITHGQEFGLLNVNKQIRDMVRPWFLSKTRFTLILRSDTSQPTKTLYEVLEPRIAESFEDAYDSDPHMRCCTPIEAAQDHENEPTIILQFQTANHIQINAWDLLWTTTIFPPGTTIIFRVRDCSDNVHVTTLGEIRRYALVFLEDLMDKETPDPHWSTVEFWLNEQCLPVRATIQGEHQGSEHACEDVVDVSNMMDVTTLHNAVEAREWRPYEELDGFRGITQPTSWGHETFDDLVKCLRSLCL
ncbi:hypothetical protein IG631_21902 [Alternaria alternata]|nr:hypothetical protein IG631_21902 [Alternaria alternata]